MNEWHKYPEAVFSHYIIGQKQDYQGFPIVDETACGVLMDIRGSQYGIVDMSKRELRLCEQCELYQREHIVEELAE